jgi:hypothetical protein
MMRNILTALALISLVSILGCSTYNTATRGGQFFGTGAVAARGMDVAQDMCTTANGERLPCSLTAVSTPHGASVSTSNGGYYGYPYGASVPYTPGMPLGGSTGNPQLDAALMYRATHPGVPYNQTAGDLAAAGVYQSVRQGNLTQAAVAGNTAAIYDVAAAQASTAESVRGLETEQAASAAEREQIAQEAAQQRFEAAQQLRRISSAAAGNRERANAAGQAASLALEVLDEGGSNGSAPPVDHQIEIAVPAGTAEEDDR